MSLPQPADTDLEEQCDEVLAMSAIYGDDWTLVEEPQRIYAVTLGEDDHKLQLEVQLPEAYPSQLCPSFTFRNASWLRGESKQHLTEQLNLVWEENRGQPILFKWAECVLEFLSQVVELEALSKNHDYENVKTSEETVSWIMSTEEPETDIPCPPICHGETLKDRKSVFQAHLAPITSATQVDVVMRELMKDRKIAQATHNIGAYRCENPPASDCWDDGENAAGRRLLQLLHNMDARNVLVVVSRWYGGIQLGPDRFRHINNVARDLLMQEGYGSGAHNKAETSNKSGDNHHRHHAGKSHKH